MTERRGDRHPVGHRASAVHRPRQRRRNWSGATLQSRERRPPAVTEFLRPEDGAWDPEQPERLLLRHDGQLRRQSRLWRLSLRPTPPTRRGRHDRHAARGHRGRWHGRAVPHARQHDRRPAAGRVLLQEDPGGQNYLARIWRTTSPRDTLTEVAHHDPARFSPGLAGLAHDRRGVLGDHRRPRILGEGWYLGDVQAHYPNGPELVEGGQLFALYVPPDEDENEDEGDED